MLFSFACIIFVVSLLISIVGGILHIAILEQIGRVGGFISIILGLIGLTVLS